MSTHPKKEYTPKELEQKWKDFWNEEKVYKTEIDKSKQKMHVLDMFPYPSGEGLHAGHCKIFSASDAYARMKRMQGYNVLHATGWDAFGLPAEQYALKNKVHPKDTTKKNTDTFRRQMQMMGLSYDWDREINTTDPKFYKWTQWIFLEMYKKGLVFESFEPINWCPSCKTGLANEDLEGNACERCGSVVEKKPIRQWVIRITDYADKLLRGVDGLAWKENIKDLQRNWIGESQGAEIDFKIKSQNSGEGASFTIFTTRPDTLFGCTYCVFAPEHKLIKDLLDNGQITNKSEIERYIEEVKLKTEIERSAEGREKTGVELQGVKAVNPANGEEVPVFIADYVLATYGSGAIMAVPAHDQRDFEFAKKYNISVKSVILPGKYIQEKNKTENNLEKEGYEFLIEKFLSGDAVYSDQGVLVNSGQFDGLTSEEAKGKITEFVGGKMVTKYKLRDWVFARQRYWGEPMPLVHVEDLKLDDHAGSEAIQRKVYAIDQSQLPVELPDVAEYEPTGDGESPLANITEWVNVEGYVTKDNTFIVLKTEEVEDFKKQNPDVQILKAKRETNTMPQWAGSSWYWMRFLDPQNNDRFVGLEEEKYWSSKDTCVDMYFGGLEHATRHLIYGRFWHQFLYDHGYVSAPEPFNRLEGVGLVLGDGGVKMSKRLGNIVNPDEVVEKWGADTMRLYLFFMGAYHDAVVWNDQNIIGPRRFIEKVWALQYKLDDAAKLSEDTEILLNQTIKKVTEDNEGLRFNTSVSALMILVNALEKEISLSKDVYKAVIKLLAPFTPFMCEEVWSILGETGSVHHSNWPLYDEAKITNKMVTLAIQINGKVRGEVTSVVDAPNEDVIKLAEASESYKKWVGEATPKKVIVVKNKVINIVV